MTMESIFRGIFIILIGSYLFGLGRKIGLLIAKKLFPSLPTNFTPPSWSSFFVCLGLLFTLITLFVTLQDTLGLDIIQIPEWVPFYEVVRLQEVDISLLSLFIAVVLAPMITNLFLAWWYVFLQKRTKINGKN